MKKTPEMRLGTLVAEPKGGGGEIVQRDGAPILCGTRVGDNATSRKGKTREVSRGHNDPLDLRKTPSKKSIAQG